MASDCFVYDVHRLDGYRSVLEENKRSERRRQVCSTHKNAFHFVEDDTFDDDWRRRIVGFLMFETPTFLPE